MLRQRTPSLPLPRRRLPGSSRMTVCISPRCINLAPTRCGMPKQPGASSRFLRSMGVSDASTAVLRLTGPIGARCGGSIMSRYTKLRDALDVQGGEHVPKPITVQGLQRTSGYQRLIVPAEMRMEEPPPAKVAKVAKDDGSNVGSGPTPALLGPQFPCAVCGKQDRWYDRGIWRCLACCPGSLRANLGSSAPHLRGFDAHFGEFVSPKMPSSPRPSPCHHTWQAEGRHATCAR